MDSLKLETLSTINHTGALIVSLVCNSILCLFLYLKKQCEITHYRRVLTIQGVVDVISATLFYLFSARCVMVDGEFFIIITGFWANVNYATIFGYNLQLKYFAIGTYAFATFSVLLCIPLNFYFRYQLICYSKRLSQKFTIIFLLFITLIGVTQGAIGCYETYSNRFKETPLVDDVMITYYNSYYKLNTSLPLPYMVFTAHSMSTFFYVLYAFINVVVAYSTNILCGIAIYKRLNLNKNVTSKKTIYLQKQINKIMVIQAITPLIVISLPIVIFIGVVFSQLDRLDMFCLNFLVVWMPATSSFVTITFVPVFRKQVWNLFRRSEKVIPTTNNTAAISSNANSPNIEETKFS